MINRFLFGILSKREFYSSLYKGMTIGNYVFELTVSDENKNNATDRVNVTVVQGMT